jgi:hypothetical protein
MTIGDCIQKRTSIDTLPPTQEGIVGHVRWLRYRVMIVMILDGGLDRALEAEALRSCGDSFG